MSAASCVFKYSINLSLKNVKCKLEYGVLYLIEFKIKTEENKKTYIIEKIGAVK